MKMLIYSSALVIISSISATQLNAQDFADINHKSEINTTVSVATAPAPADESKKLLLNEVNSRALRDFGRQFPKAQSSMWLEGKAGISVYFTNDGQKMRITYSKNGNREYSIKYYDESSMPADVRHTVKSTYYDYSIMLVTEVDRNGTICYIVKMASEKEFLTVKVVDGQMEVFERTLRLK